MNATPREQFPTEEERNRVRAAAELGVLPVPDHVRPWTSVT